MKAKKKTKRKLNIKRLFVLLLIIYFCGYSGYYLYQQPIKNIIITGNVLVSDADVIKAAGLKEYPSIFSISSKKLKKKIMTIPLIEGVTIKKDLKFRLKITIDEAKVVFFNSTNSKLMLSNGSYIEPSDEYTGIPTLINYAPEATLKEFAIKLGVVDYGIISLISEIAYSRSTGADGEAIDETRFILYMNDGNQVYTNPSKCQGLTHYREFFASIKDVKGIWFLDSNYKSSIFRPFESKNEIITP